ncbi:NAD(P)H-hydrate epimerase [Gemmatimonadota bacterium]
MRFVRSDGREVMPVSRAQMLEIDRIAVGESGPSLLQMMENAGRSLAGLIVRDLGERSHEARVLVMAGNGGNGGGGICAARHLAARVGGVDLCLVEPARLSRAARDQLAIFRLTEAGEVLLDALEESLPYDIVVDAVIGYSLSGAPRGEAERAIRRMTDSRAPVFSLDLPSGVDADTGQTPGRHITATATLTLHLPKPGLWNPAAGALWMADLGIPPRVTRRVGIEPPDYGLDFVSPLERG